MFSFNFGGGEKPASGGAEVQQTGKRPRLSVDGAPAAAPEKPSEESARAPAAELPFDPERTDEPEDAFVNHVRFGPDGSVVLRAAVAGKLEVDAQEADHSDVIRKTVEGATDLIPGVYEGGLKVWECSQDLVEYLIHLKVREDKAGNPDVFRGLRVLEVGCGAGYPGLYALTQGADVDFQDYNGEVLRGLTVPNVLLNRTTTLEDLQQDNRGNPGSLGSHAATPTVSRYTNRFFSGDWGELAALMARANVPKYDIVLTAETVYSAEAQQRLFDFCASVLKPPGEAPSDRGGVMYVAAKTYYFGVGGSMRDFERLVQADGRFDAALVAKVDEGVSREIMAVSWRRQDGSTGGDRSGSEEKRGPDTNGIPSVVDPTTHPRSVASKRKHS